MLVGIWGCNSDNLAPPTVNPGAAGQAALSQYDTNKNGTLDAEELAQAPGFQAALKSCDQDGDGQLTAAEIAARVKNIVGEEVGMLQMQCMVTLDGQPLANAMVTAIPEKALGDQFRTAKGTTNAQGLAGLSMGMEGFPGMQCGIFKIEISHKDEQGVETLPAKYNTATTLGMEVALDLPTTERGLTFALSSRPDSKK
jgi:hypothetical protein